MVLPADLAYRRLARRALAKERTWTIAAVVLGGLAILQFASLAILWFLPYHVTGFANEIGLLLLAAVAGMGALWLLRRGKHAPIADRIAVCVAAALYAMASFARLGWSDGGPTLGAYHYALFSTPGCDFTARFSSPPQFGRFTGAGFEADRANVAPIANLAILADLATFSSYRAECQPLSGDGAMAATRAVAQMAALRWAEQSGVRIARQSLDRDARGDVFQLDGDIGGSILPEQPGQKSRTLVGMRSYVGEHSIMTVYVFQPQGDSLSAASLAFLDGVQRR